MNFLVILKSSRPTGPLFASQVENRFFETNKSSTTRIVLLFLAACAHFHLPFCMPKHPIRGITGAKPRLLPSLKQLLAQEAAEAEAAQEVRKLRELRKLRKSENAKSAK
jgi:hypothetical protein